MHRNRKPLLGSVLTLLALAVPVAQAWPEVPMPEDAQYTPVSAHMEHNGLPMRAGRYTTVLSPDQLVGFYHRQWGQGRADVTVLEDRRIIGHHQGKHFITVEVRAEGRGSLAQIGITELLGRTPAQPPGHGFPQPAGTRVITDTRFLDDPGRTVSLEVRLPVAQAWEWYRARLQQQGWQHDARAGCAVMARQCSASFQRGREAMTLTFDHQPGHTAVVANQLRR
jgi:hypothetical protein